MRDSTEKTTTGGRAIVSALVQAGADMAFCVAGESYLEVLDALVDAPEIRLITCRHEAGAAFMAEAYGKLTGRPGVVLVTRGPGACNASIGIHTAFQDSTPMIVLIGQVARDQVEREAFQELDYRRMFAQTAKWVAEIDQPDRIGELVGRAFRTAVAGRPGPVVLALPEDMLREACVPPVVGALPKIETHPGAEDIDRLVTLLAAAERPMLLVGGGGWTDAAAAALADFAAANGLPVCCSFRRQDVLDNRHPSYIGDLGTGVAASLTRRVREADLLIVLGARLGEITTQAYTLLDRAPTLVHVHASAEEIGRVYPASLAIHATMPAIMSALSARRVEPRWRAWTAAARADYESTLVVTPNGFDLDLGAVMGWLRDALPRDAIITSDAGNFAGWAQRYLSYGRPGRQLGPTNGAMGYGVPAGVAAKLLHPGRTVVTCVGDGGFMMTGQEIATAMRQGVGPIVLLFNNGMYGTIRMHQEKRFPGRVSGTDLTNPDFTKLAEAYGAGAFKVASTGDFAGAFMSAAGRPGPSIIELIVDPEQITTRATITDLRRASQPTP